MKILSFDQSRCTRCGACQIVCSLLKKGQFLPGEARIRIESAGEEQTDSPVTVNGPALRAVVCQHCAEPVCVTACMRGIIHKDEKTGKVTRQSEDCFRCAACQVLCPVGAAVLDKGINAFVTCDLCGAEMENGSLPDGEPACVHVCTFGALRYEGPGETSAILRDQYVHRMLGVDTAPETDWNLIGSRIRECTGKQFKPQTLAAWSDQLKQAADEEVL